MFRLHRAHGIERSRAHGSHDWTLCRGGLGLPRNMLAIAQAQLRVHDKLPRPLRNSCIADAA